MLAAFLASADATFDLLDLPLDSDIMKPFPDLMLGAAFVAYDDRRNMAEQAVNCTEFYRNESCGKCVPCRIGSQKLAQMLRRLIDRQAAIDLELVNDLADAMYQTSICGLGQVVPNGIRSVLRYFPDDLNKYLRAESQRTLGQQHHVADNSCGEIRCLSSTCTRYSRNSAHEIRLHAQSMPTSETEEFDRLIGDQLVTLGRSFDDLFTQGRIKLTIDGQEIEMNRIIRAYDAMDRRVPPRRTTIYDAVNELYRKAGGSQPGSAADVASASGANRPVPVLCHREHMRPAAVCRVCMVELKGAPRLVAACHQPIEPGMVVSTIRTSRACRKRRSVVAELLLADHQSLKDKHGSEGSWRQSGEDEFEALAEAAQFAGSRFATDGIDRGQDDSSPVISVDHNACILCDRCVRACNEVKENGVLARMNKGYGSRIAFDLNDPMGESSCVACGECMISCPTGALSNRMVINVELDQKPAGEQRRSSGEIVEPQYLLQHPLFKDISLPFLIWNRNAILRRTYKKGDVVCREGEFGATAFIIESGKFDVHINPAKGRAAAKHSGGVLELVSEDRLRCSRERRCPLPA